MQPTGQEFTGLDDDLRFAFLKIAIDRRHGSGTRLIEEQSFDGPVLLLEGRADILRHTLDGKTVIFNQVVGGSMLGLHAMIAGDAHASSVVARSPGRSAVARREDFIRLIDDPAHHRALQRSLVDDVRELSRRVFELSTLKVRDRLVNELLRCTEKTEKEGWIDGDGRTCFGSFRLSPSPTQADLAARISTHREAVSREMSRLARLGLIVRQGRDLVIPSRAALTRSTTRQLLPKMLQSGHSSLILNPSRRAPLACSG